MKFQVSFAGRALPAASLAPVVTVAVSVAPETSWLAGLSVAFVASGL